jgi:uncharacterized peroxidase-related enzyme
MSSFAVHTETTAPEASKEALAGVRQALGFAPNLMGVLAGAPGALEGYLTLSRLFESSSLTPVERNVVLLSVSFENGCDYCMAAHTGVAKMQGVPEDFISALRDGSPIKDAKLQALRAFTASITRQRANLPESGVDGFLAAGFTQRQVLEVILGVTQKTLSNYVNHLAHTPLDAAFAPLKWSRPAVR